MAGSRKDYIAVLKPDGLYFALVGAHGPGTLKRRVAKWAEENGVEYTSIGAREAQEADLHRKDLVAKWPG